VPYISELCLFAAAFVAAFAYGDAVIQHVKDGGRRLIAWRRGRGQR
jgi:hypothetical protein